MFDNLDPVLHSQLRLAVMSLLMGLEEAEFVYLKEKTKATSGNLSVQLDKLVQAKYITLKKSFKGKYPVTKATITTKGERAFNQYVQALKSYIK
jgi:hypothetical protein